MTNEVNTAVTSVTPKGSEKAPPVAKKARKGRPALKLKNGRLYAEAKAEAKADVITTKRAKAAAKADFKIVERAANALNRDGEKLAKNLAKAEAVLAKTPKDAAAKAAVKNVKEDIKAHNAAVKAKTKELGAAAKLVGKATTAYEKATAALLKVEEAKLQTLN